MKKFSKICLIIVAVLGGMGLLLGGISALLGGGFGAIRRMAERGELDAGNWHIRPYELYYSSDEEDTEDDWGADDDAKVYTYEAAGIKIWILILMLRKSMSSRGRMIKTLW